MVQNTNRSCFAGPRITRRGLLGIAVGGATACALSRPGRAKTPSTIVVGSFRLTLLSDGHLMLPEAMFAPRVSPAERAAALAAAGQSGPRIRSPLNVTLVETGTRKILIDVGSGTRFMDTAGQLADALQAKGIATDAITDVVYTHAHPDHIWGTIDDFDEVAFPNARFFISEGEWNYWMANDVLTTLPKERHGFAVGAQRNLKAIKDRLTTFKPGHEFMPGLAALDTAGHTPGHISLEVASGNERVVVLGDAINHPVISFRHPAWQPASDQIPDKAARTRVRLLDRLATDGARIIGYHLPTPGAGRVERKGGAYAYMPLA